MDFPYRKILLVFLKTYRYSLKSSSFVNYFWPSHEFHMTNFSLQSMYSTDLKFEAFVYVTVSYGINQHSKNLRNCKLSNIALPL